MILPTSVFGDTFLTAHAIESSIKQLNNYANEI